MKKSTDKRMVRCIFNHNHVMPLMRYQWHLAKCQDRIERESKGLKTYVCKFHSMHMFLSRQDLDKHEPECAKRREEAAKKTEKLYEVFDINDNSDIDTLEGATGSRMIKMSKENKKRHKNIMKRY